ncbi:MAG: glycoside hydrolase family 140 protein [Bacteroidota bacterium]|nr:glycoside hydrolase family 140 protein [Bacteroidota bacterium]
MKKLLTIAVFLIAATFYLQGQNGMSLLRVSANKKFLADEKGHPVFWLGDTGWLLFSKTTREEASTYLDDRSKKGFNVIQVMVIHDLKDNVDVYGDSALINCQLNKPRITPGKTFGHGKEYDYWDNMDFVIDLAAKKGLYMALVPIWGANVKSGHVSRQQAHDFAAFLAKRYKDRKNIIWINGGDVKGSDSTEIWNIIGNTLRANDSNHLITFHPFGRHTSSLWFHNQPWLDFNMFQSGHRAYAQDTMPAEQHYGPDNWKYPGHDLALRPQKPTLDGEPSYEQIPYGLHDTLQPYWNENDVRRYAYWEVFAGGCGFTYGHNSVMQFYKPTDKGKAYGAKKYWFQAINDPGAGQMRYLKKLMLSRSYFDRIPDQSIIFGDPGWHYDYIAATRGPKYVYVYTYNGRPFKVNMGKIPGKTVKASWFNPRNGEITQIGPVRNEGIVEFKAPGVKKEGNDWVLILDQL